MLILAINQAVLREFLRFNAIFSVFDLAFAEAAFVLLSSLTPCLPPREDEASRVRTCSMFPA